MLLPGFVGFYNNQNYTQVYCPHALENFVRSYVKAGLEINWTDNATKSKCPVAYQDRDFTFPCVKTNHSLLLHANTPPLT